MPYVHIRTLREESHQFGETCIQVSLKGSFHIGQATMEPVSALSRTSFPLFSAMRQKRKWLVSDNDKSSSAAIASIHITKIELYSLMRREFQENFFENDSAILVDITLVGQLLLLTLADITKLTMIGEKSQHEQEIFDEPKNDKKSFMSYRSRKHIW